MTMNVDIKLLFVVGTCSALLPTIIQVLLVYGNIYNSDASTIVTYFSDLYSDLNSLTSDVFHILLMIESCLPANTMLTWKTNIVLNML